MTLLPIIDQGHGRPSTVRFFHDSPYWHRFDSENAQHIYLADGSRVYSISRQAAQALDNASDDPQILQALGISRMNAIDDEPASGIPIRALSLAVAQTCNLGCTYCYADGGSFGGAAKNMPLAVALKAVERLLEHVDPGERVNLAFLGGEPLVNRAVVRAATELARRKADECGIDIRFSITTNGTRVTDDDGDFFERYGFAVTISLDGIGEVHDRQRSFKGGRGSYDQIMARVQLLLKKQRRMQVSARVTVTPRNLCLRETLEQLVRLGFHSVGFSPMLSSPTGRDEMDGDELREMLCQMIACGREFEKQVIAGGRFPFSNMVNAMKEIHRGTHRPYPCGAGGGYFGVSADGNLFACHRFVDDPAGAMGDLDNGVDANRQGQWLADRHVHFQQPCSSCWARYLCGGGCHHEVIHRGRPACDYIRGWLHYCLQAYVRLLERRPDYFGMTDH